MGETAGGQPLDVVGHDVIAALDQGQRLGSGIQGQGRPRAAAQVNIGMMRVAVMRSSR